MAPWLASLRNQFIVSGAAAVAVATYINARFEEAEALQAASSIPANDSTANSTAALTPPADSRSAVSLHDVSAASGFCDSSEFLDSRRSTLWELQTSNITPAYLKNLLESPKTSKQFGVEVLKGTSHYASTVKPMRVVGYFPNVAPAVLQAHITDQALRLRWDKNYDMFSLLHSEDATTLAAAVPDIGKASISDAIQNVLPKNALDKMVTREWGCHRVTSSLLQKLGVKAKLFQYERASWSIFNESAYFVAYRSIVDSNRSYPLTVSVPATAAPVKKGVIHYTEDHASFMRILDVFFKRYEKPDDDKVIMHHQTIALLPIEGSSTAVLEHALLDARTVGSVTHSSFLDAVKQNRQRAVECDKDKVSVQGTLMIMTSLNETPIPKGIPQWAQKRAAHFFTAQAYEMLYQCALHADNNHHTK